MKTRPGKQSSVQTNVVLTSSEFAHKIQGQEASPENRLRKQRGQFHRPKKVHKQICKI